VSASLQPVSCRPLQEADVDTLLQFLPGTLSGQWHRESLLGSAWEKRVLVAAGGSSEPIGFAEFYVAADECHLLNIAIAPAYRRGGLGNELLRAVTEEAVRRGCRACLLEVRASNMAAIALYERAGFVRVATRKGYYPAIMAGQDRGAIPAREDALIYSRELSPSS
jgi:ribosomal-protein-alanine N-acetyltransferase